MNRLDTLKFFVSCFGLRFLDCLSHLCIVAGSEDSSHPRGLWRREKGLLYFLRILLHFPPWTAIWQMFLFREWLNFDDLYFFRGATLSSVSWILSNLTQFDRSLFSMTSELVLYFDMNFQLTVQFFKGPVSWDFSMKARTSSPASTSFRMEHRGVAPRHTFSAGRFWCCALKAKSQFFRLSYKHTNRQTINKTEKNQPFVRSKSGFFFLRFQWLCIFRDCFPTLCGVLHLLASRPWPGICENHRCNIMQYHWIKNDQCEGNIHIYNHLKQQTYSLRWMLEVNMCKYRNMKPWILPIYFADMLKTRQDSVDFRAGQPIPPPTPFWEIGPVQLPLRSASVVAPSKPKQMSRPWSRSLECPRDISID